jgi:hypothetical protein
MQSILRQRPYPESYTKEDIKNIKLLSFTDDGAMPFGSASYIIQKYPGDLDLYEIIIENDTIEGVISSFAKKMQKVITAITDLNDHWVTEVKAGVDSRFDLSIGTLINGKYVINIDNVISMMRILSSIENGDISDEADEILYMISDPRQSRSQDTYEAVSEFFRNLKVIRWTAKEIKKGKIMKNGMEISLIEALHSKAHVKIDMITFLDGKFTEVTNFFFLASMIDDKLHLINTSFDFTDQTQFIQNYEQQIKNEVEKLLYSRDDFSPFKAAKRMWAFSRVFYNTALIYKQTIDKLTPIISGDISLMYQIKSEIDAILLIYSKAPKTDLNERIQFWKVSLSHIINLTDSDLSTFLSILDMLLGQKSIENFKIFKDALVSKINQFTIKDLTQIGYFPPPSVFLPSPRRFV